MPAEIDTGGPRVLHCDPDCPIFICENKHPEDSIKSRYGISQEYEFARDAWRQRKNRRRESRKNFMDKPIENCPQVKAIRQASHRVTVKTKYLCASNPVKETLITEDDLEEHQPRVLKRFLEFPTESSQCSGPNRSSISNDTRQSVTSSWLVNNKPSVQNVECRNDTTTKTTTRTRTTTTATATKVSEKWRKRTKNQSRQSYLHIVFLFFLIVAGHSGVTRSSIFEIVTISTMFSVAASAPVHLDFLNRSERHTNGQMHHITGTSRPLRIFIHNHYLQIGPDGHVNGTTYESIYTIFRRKIITDTVDGVMAIQALATCRFLCINERGFVYSSEKIKHDCLLKEDLLDNHYNVYSSASWSTCREVFYLAMKKNGQLHRYSKAYHDHVGECVQHIQTLTPFEDKMESFNHSCTIPETVESLDHPHRHQHRLKIKQLKCNASVPKTTINANCLPKAKKYFKNERRNGGTKSRASRPANSRKKSECKGPPESKRSCEGAARDELFRKQLLTTSSKKRKSRIKGHKQNRQNARQRKRDPRTKLKRPRLPGNATDLNKHKMERSTRINLPVHWENSSVLSGYTPTPGDASSKRKFEVSPKNAVTIASKPGTSLRNSHGSLETPFIPKDSTEDTSLLSSALEASEDPPASNDTSIENSELESSLEDDQEAIDYETSMTTMDTTPLGRTEDYIKATTPTHFDSFEARSTRSADHLEKSSVDPPRLPYGRLAM